MDMNVEVDHEAGEYTVEYDGWKDGPVNGALGDAQN